jgi:hypothetical protein
MAKNPDPNLPVTTLTGSTRTLDDWTTMFHLVLVVLPDRPEGAAWVPIAERIFATFGDSDAKVAFLVPGNEIIARRLLDGAEHRYTVFLDPDRTLIESLGLTRLPAFVHLRQDTTVASATEGWDPREWQRVAREIGRAMAWTYPEVSRRGDPARTEGWPALLS